MSFTSLDLSNNRLSGPLLPELCELAQLNYLSLRNNRFSGPLPAEIGENDGIEFTRFDIEQVFGSSSGRDGTIDSLAVVIALGK